MGRLGPEGEPNLPPRIARRYILRPGTGGVLRERPHRHTAAEGLGREHNEDRTKPFIPAYVRKAPPIELDD